MGLRNDQGIVLRSYPFGEADRIVVLLSPNHGKIRAVAKGIRRTKSRFGGRLEPFTQVDLVLYEGRNLDTVTQAAPIDTFPSLRRDLDRVTIAGAMVESVDLVAQEDESSLRLYLLLQRGLKTLDEYPPHPDLLTSFLLKLAAIVGVAPALTRCASCGRADSLERFSFGAGGAICDRCPAEGTAKLHPGLIDYLAQLAEADLPALGPPSDEFSGQAMGLTRKFVEYHVERPLRSAVMLDA